MARAAEREVVCRLSRRDDDGAGDGGSEARRMIEGEHGGGGGMGSTTGGRRSERELSSGQCEGEGHRTASFSWLRYGPSHSRWSSR